MVTYQDAFECMIQPKMLLMILALCVPFILKSFFSYKAGPLFAWLFLIYIPHAIAHAYTHTRFYDLESPIGLIVFLAFGIGYSLLILRKGFKKGVGVITMIVFLLLASLFGVIQYCAYK